jgi:hypothetical protein
MDGGKKCAWSFESSNKGFVKFIEISTRVVC